MLDDGKEDSCGRGQREYIGETGCGAGTTVIFNVRVTESGTWNLFDSLQNYESRHNAQYRTNLSSLSSLGKGKGIAMPHSVVGAVLSSRGLSVGGGC